MKDINKIFAMQKSFFASKKTLDVEYRISMLKKLKKVLKDNEEKIIDAMHKDLGKSSFEGYATEIGLVYEEINYAIKKTKKWCKREKARSSLIYFPSKSYIYKEPYGVCLIIGPFNYPFQLIMNPLVGAISAGNCSIIKPSEHSVNVSKLIEKIINDNFDEKYIAVVDPLGGKEVVSTLLDMKFDKIFFTGSVRVGKIVMEKASRNLIPVTLELGGKSPCIVDKDANIKMAAKRIVWGKYLNAGQTCVAPDYLLVHRDIKEELLKEMVIEIERQYGTNIKESIDYPRIINEKEVNRLSKYIDEGKIYYGGEVDVNKKYIYPTILVDVDEEASISREEIFGPIFPVYEFEDIYKVISDLSNKEKPLALYYFSENKNKIKMILNNTSSGGVTINDTVIHVSMPNLPFGGVGNSGMGSYHGRASFDEFTHNKSVVNRGSKIEFSFRFPPYEEKIKLIKKIMK